MFPVFQVFLQNLLPQEEILGSLSSIKTFSLNTFKDTLILWEGGQKLLDLLVTFR
jgi:hypothetical protein